MSVIDELKRLEAETTPGPWDWERCYSVYAPRNCQPNSGRLGCVFDDNGYASPEDAAFIALSRNSLPALLAVVDAAREFQSLTHWGMSDSEAELSDKLNKALAQVEK